MSWQFAGHARPDIAIEPNPGQESVWDYPRPPICVEDSREVVVRLDSVIVARSSNCIRVLETASPPTFYIPRCDIQMDLLVKSQGITICEWKGVASYWSLKRGGADRKNVAWSYERPLKRFGSIRGYLSFYPARLECTVAGERVRPQPGEFYGGWVTDEIVGPFKGGQGTSTW